MSREQAEVLLRSLDDLPSPAGKPFVRVFDGEERTGRPGFLLSVGAQSFTVLHGLTLVELSTPSLSPEDAAESDAPEPPRYVRAPESLVEIVRVLPADANWEDLVAWARVARAQHRADLVVILLTEAAKRAPATGEPMDPSDALRRAIGCWRTADALQRYANGSLGTEVLAQRLRVVAALAGDLDVGKRARRDVEVLEGAAAANVHPDSPSFETVDRYVRWLVAELPQDRAWCTSWVWGTGSQWLSVDSVGRLQGMGYNAVPALLEAAEDLTPTRCLASDAGLSSWAPRQVAPHVPEDGALPDAVRVRDVALHVLGWLAGRTFSNASAARAWWMDGGQHETLERSFQADGRAVVEEARARMKRDHADGVRWVIDTARASRGRLRVALTRVLAESTVAMSKHGKRSEAEALRAASMLVESDQE